MIRLATIEFYSGDSELWWFELVCEYLKLDISCADLELDVLATRANISFDFRFDSS